MEILFQELCEILKPKLECVENSMKYVGVREYLIALEFISDWCIDSEPELRLTANELLKIKEVGDQLNTQGPWIELLPLLLESEMGAFPKNYLENAVDYIEKELMSNPIRAKWLSKVNTAIELIKKSA